MIVYVGYTLLVLMTFSQGELINNFLNFENSCGNLA